MASHKRRVNTNTDHIKCGHGFFNVVLGLGIKKKKSIDNVLVIVLVTKKKVLKP